MKKTLLVFFSLAIIITACNLPGNDPILTQESPDAVYTHAAETMSAELTRVALVASPTPNIPTNTSPPLSTDTPLPTYTPYPTNTPIFTASNTPLPCLKVGYDNATIDVTYPDNSILTPGQTFTKIWRVKNEGTCTWNSSYQLIFDHGDPMGVSTTYSQPLTPGTVSPGQTVDISVNLTAPMAPGTYTGYWRFRDPSNVLFGIDGLNPWLVIIKVVNSTTVTLLPLVGESGTIRSDAGPWGDFTAGESNTAPYTNLVQAFLSYNIASIPSNATITEVKMNFTAYTITGNPFSLGILNGYITDYGSTLEPSDFSSGFPSGNTVDWGSLAALNVVEVSPEMKAALQSRVGTSRLQLRLQFAGSNLDGTKDRITFTNPSLVITYTTP